MYVRLRDLKIRKLPWIFQLNPASAHEHFKAKWEAEESGRHSSCSGRHVRDIQASEIEYAIPGSEVTWCRDGKGLQLRE